MNVEIGAEAALFPEKEYISGIFMAVRKEEAVSFCLNRFLKIINKLRQPLSIVNENI
jgi:hypothetical protein